MNNKINVLLVYFSCCFSFFAVNSACVSLPALYYQPHELNKERKNKINGSCIFHVAQDITKLQFLANHSRFNINRCFLNDFA